MATLSGTHGCGYMTIAQMAREWHWWKGIRLPAIITRHWYASPDFLDRLTTLGEQFYRDHWEFYCELYSNIKVQGLIHSLQTFTRYLCNVKYGCQVGRSAA